MLLVVLANAGLHHDERVPLLAQIAALGVAGALLTVAALVASLAEPCKGKAERD